MSSQIIGHMRIPSADLTLRRSSYSLTCAVLPDPSTAHSCTTQNSTLLQEHTHPAKSLSFDFVSNKSNGATFDLSYRDANVASFSPSYSLPQSTPPLLHNLFKDFSALYLPFRHPLRPSLEVLCRHHAHVRRVLAPPHLLHFLRFPAACCFVCVDTCLF